jgi:DNA-binding MarR family transcriptional regulator
METISKSSENQNAQLLSRLVQDLIRLHPPIILPEHVRRFKQQMDRLKQGNVGSREDYRFIFRIFIVLADKQLPPTMGELSTELNVPYSTATRIVDWLVRGGFVERIPDLNDRRIIRVQLTQTGRHYYELSMEVIRQRIQKLLLAFTIEEQEELCHLLKKLINVLVLEQDNDDQKRSLV